MNILGLHGRNDEYWPDADYEAIAYIRPHWLKMMGNTDASVFERLRQLLPDVKFITRLYVGGFGEGHRHPSPDEFAKEAIEQIRPLLPFCSDFEVHNEPNHLHGIEGWGDTEADADDFNRWFSLVYHRINDLSLRSDYQLRLGFPGLAVPHNDLMWLDKCRPAIEMSDWLGCHCYWQAPDYGDKNHLSREWGLKFALYSDLYPDHDIYITEAGNSNCQATYEQKKDGKPYPIDWALYATEFVEWFTELDTVSDDCVHLRKYPKLIGAMPFLLSSPDKNWDGFAWLASDGRKKAVVEPIAKLNHLD